MDTPSMLLGKFGRDAAATLLRFSKSTSDPKLAAALIDKAAEIQDRADDMSLRKMDLSPRPPDIVDSEKLNAASVGRILRGRGSFD